MAAKGPQDHQDEASVARVSDVTVRTIRNELVVGLNTELKGKQATEGAVALDSKYCPCKAEYAPRHG